MNLQFLGKATHIPASSIAKLEIPFRGRNLAIPGDRTFNDWSVTILNDPDWQNRTAMEELEGANGRSCCAGTTAV